MKRTILGLTGSKGAGKTTAFGIIKEFRPEVLEITLANKLKNASAEVFGIPRADFDNPAVKEKELDTPVTFDAENVTALIEFFKITPDFDKHVRQHIGKVLLTPREIAQYVGTEVLRNVNEDIHCLGATQDLPENGLFCITDLRFWSEFFYFKNNQEISFVPVYISNRAAEAKAALDSHVSEKYVLEIAKKCVRVDNNGSLLELRRQLEGLVKEL